MGMGQELTDEEFCASIGAEPWCVDPNYAPINPPDVSTGIEREPQPADNTWLWILLAALGMVVVAKR